jgi:glycosyltransferase involved in cell wall biosynthesis
MARTPGSFDRLRILHVAHKFPPFIGGIEMHTFEVGRRMAQLGHEVTILTADATGRLPQQAEMDGMRIVRVQAYPRSSDIYFAPGIRAAMRRGSWDIAHVQGFHTLVPPIAMATALEIGLPFVFTFHSGGHSDSWRNAIRGVQREVLRPLLVRADQLIGVSEFEADHFAAGLRIPRDRIEVVPNGSQIELPARPVTPDPERPLLLSIGRLERYKGHHRAIKSFKYVLREYPQAQLRILGEGPYKATLQALVDELGLGASVTIGGIPPAERWRMAEVMCEAALIVLLSEYEAHPVTALEALSLNRPVLATDATGFHEMVVKGQVRGIAPQADDRQVAAAILDEIAGPQRSPSRDTVPDWEQCAEHLVDIYRQVLARRRLPQAAE